VLGQEAQESAAAADLDVVAVRAEGEDPLGPVAVPQQSESFHGG
jgi:hypothetical protein